MNEPLIFGYMLKLSTHMWDDATTPPHGWYLEPRYRETNDTDLEVWDETVRFLGKRKYNLVLIDVGDGIQYESHPEISAPDAWSKDFLKAKLDEMRALGLEPIPKLNFSTGHDTWLKGYNRMISTPEYYRVASDLIREVCEAFGSPRLFHLGFDEEAPGFQKNHAMIVVRNADLWWHDLFFLCRECEKHGARPWIWSDYCWNNKELFVKNMSKSILQSNWYYGTFKDFPETDHHYLEISTYELLDSLGFEQIPTGSTWTHDDNYEQTVAYGKNRLSPELLKGYLAAPWQFTTKLTRYTLLDDAERLYFARKKWYPETLG